MSVGTMTAELKKIFDGHIPVTQEDSNTIDLPTVGGSVSLQNHPTNKGEKPDPSQEVLFHPEKNSGTYLKNYPEAIGEAGVMPQADDENMISQSTKTSITLANNKPVNPGGIELVGKSVASTDVPRNEDANFVTPSRLAGVTLKNYPVGAKGQGTAPYKMVEAGEKPLFKPADDATLSNRPKRAVFDHGAAANAAQRHTGSALVKEVGGQSDDFILKSTSAWITVDNLSVYLKRTDEGVVVDVYPTGHEGDDEPVASTYAFFSEADNLEDV